MILLTVEEVIMLHDKLLAVTGGLPGLRDRGFGCSRPAGINEIRVLDLKKFH